MDKEDSVLHQGLSFACPMLGSPCLVQGAQCTALHDRFISLQNLSFSS